MIDEIDFEKYKNKIVDHIDIFKNWRETDYDSITIHFTDGSRLDINASGEDDHLTIYD